MTENENQNDMGREGLYELAFHLVSSLPEDQVGPAVTTLKDAVESNGGRIESEEFPKLRELAYEIRKKEEGRYKKYTSAYFGWIIFGADTEKVAAIKEAVTGIDAVLRFMILKDPTTGREFALAQEENKTNEAPAEETKDQEAEEVEAVADGEEGLSEDKEEVKE